jgi:hypothetical protein
MALLDSQLAALKAAILADPVLSQLDGSADSNEAIAAAFSLDADPDYYVWRTDVPVESILDAITWANYTPADAADNTVTYQNRAMLCQTKQINLQLMLQGRSTFDAGKPTLRGGLNDATTNIPSGASGASRSGGWAAILPTLKRKARRVEKLYSAAGSGVGNVGGDARGASTNPDVLAYEGALGRDDVDRARNLP